MTTLCAQRGPFHLLFLHPSTNRLAYEPYSHSPSPADDGEELLKAGRRVAIVEDAITTGGSVRIAIDVLEELGCEVTLIAVLVERHEGGGDALRRGGYDVLSIFRTDEEGQLSINEAFLERLAAQ
jgi:orotate phosphoribosyltransferase